MQHPKDTGDISMLAVILVLRALGYALFLPYGENTRCDFMLERDGFVDRVQCKTGRLRRGTIEFSVCSSYAHHRSAEIKWRTYHGEIDFFAVYCPETTGVYLIPISHLQVIRRGYLRVDPPRNNQRERVRFAADYEIGRVAVGIARDADLSTRGFPARASAMPDSDAGIRARAIGGLRASSGA